MQIFWLRLAGGPQRLFAEFDGIEGRYVAVAVRGEEFERVSQAHPLPLPVLFLMGFPPERDILRLDKVTDVSPAEAG